MSYAPDPLDEALEADTREDLAKATERGERLYRLADAAVCELVAMGYLYSRWKGVARVHVFTVLADLLYGNAAIDIPKRLGNSEKTDS